jgi:hypothetical protein
VAILADWSTTVCNGQTPLSLDRFCRQQAQEALHVQTTKSTELEIGKP